MICRHKLFHFTVANTRFTAPLTRRRNLRPLNDTIYACKSFKHKRVLSLMYRCEVYAPHRDTKDKNRDLLQLSNTMMHKCKGQNIAKLV